MDPMTSLTDESLLRCHEGIRVQVSADTRSGSRFIGQAARKRANALLGEIHRRELSITPIFWRINEVQFIKDGARAELRELL